MPTNSPKTDLKSTSKIFDDAWEDLESRYAAERLTFPAEIMWLGGAPGAGKGTNTAFIMQERGLTAPPIVMSSLLNSPQAEELKQRGQLVTDAEVVRILLEELIKPKYDAGVVVDGFPRTMIQVECVRMLYQRMQELRSRFFNTPLAPRFHRPIFRITVLFVSEAVSIERQLKRGREILAHNEEVRATGTGAPIELRPTDVDENLARERYRVFMEHTFHALNSLRDVFHYHFIDANGALDQVKRKIVEEFKYQSSLELSHATHDSIRGIPICSRLTSHARQELVQRLDNYRERHTDLFMQVIELIETQIMPALRRHTAVGRARVRLTHVTLEQPAAVDMVVDILTERGYFPTADIIEQHIPIRIDPETFSVIHATRKIWLFEIAFPTAHIRRGEH
jgi:adenylate kinase